MASSSSRRGSNLRAPKPTISPHDLAERFLEFQRLRKQVQDLEQLLATGLKKDAPYARSTETRRLVEFGLKSKGK